MAYQPTDEDGQPFPGIYCPPAKTNALSEARFNNFLENHFSHLLQRVTALETSSKMVVKVMFAILALLLAVLGVLLAPALAP